MLLIAVVGRLTNNFRSYAHAVGRPTNSGASLLPQQLQQHMLTQLSSWGR